MIIVAWNTRGLGAQRALRNLLRLISESSPYLLFISESRVSNFVASQWFSHLNFSNCFCVEAIDRSGGLLLFWNDMINVSILPYSPGHID